MCETAAATAEVEKKKDVGRSKAKASNKVILTLHEDIIRDSFWKKYPHLLK